MTAERRRERFDLCVNWAGCVRLGVELSHRGDLEKGPPISSVRIALRVSSPAPSALVAEVTKPSASDSARSSSAMKRFPSGCTGADGATATG
jgi:hypothetical protein